MDTVIQKCLSLTWDSHEGKLNMSVAVFYREEKQQQVAQGTAQPAYKVQKSATLVFATEHKVHVSCDFAAVLSHLRVGVQGNGQGPGTFEFSCSGKKGEERCYNESNFSCVCQTTSVLITTCCF